MAETKTVKIVFDPMKKILIATEESINQDILGAQATQKVTEYPQGTTLMVNGTNLRAFNGPDTLLHVPDSRIQAITIVVTQTKGIPGIKKP